MSQQAKAEFDAAMDRMVAEAKGHSIEMDCAPGGLRPGDLLPSVLEGTGVTLGEPNSMFFGNWKWVIPADQLEAFLLHRDTIKERITALYNSRRIRYGSW